MAEERRVKTDDGSARSSGTSTLSPALAALRHYDGHDRVVWASEARKELANRKIATVKFRTGIPALDLLVDGVEGGEAVIIGGKPKNGKTLLAQTLVSNFKAQGVNSLFFSYEVPTWQFLGQMPDELDFCLPIILASNGGDWLEKRIVESKLKFNTKAVFIDHLHYLIDMVHIKNPSLEIGAIIRNLKTTAIKHNIVIFIISHVGKVPKDETVNETHLRDSGMTTAEADTTWIVSRCFDKNTHDALEEAVVKVCNHRRTGTMDKSAHLIKRGRLFEEYGSEPTVALPPQGEFYEPGADNFTEATS